MIKKSYHVEKLHWIMTKSTIEFLGTWESLYNPNFKVIKLDHFKNSVCLLLQ
jgi:hypothetical protein